MDTMYDIIIVGAGPAGMTAAIYAVRANMNVLLLDKLSPGGAIINTNEVENYPGTGKLSGADLAIKMFEHTQDLGVVFDFRTVLDITEKDGIKTVHCEEDDATFTAKAVILATGTVPRRLNVPGEEQWAANGISWCAICDGAQYRGKDVVVIGGGNSAVEEATFLAGICTHVTVVTMFDLTADPKACDQLRNMSNVTIYPYQEILEFTGTDHLDGVRFRSTKEDGTTHHVPCHGVFEYSGFIPCSPTFAGLGITDAMGCIQADAHMRTTVPGIFGAGDITVKHLRQIVTACADGATAANSAAAYVEQLKEPLRDNHD